MTQLLIAWVALLPAFCLLGLVELFSQIQVGDIFSGTGWVLFNNALTICVGFCFWCVITVPWLFLTQAYLRWRILTVCGLLVLLVTAALIHYFAVAGVALGADLFAYSWSEINTTLAGADTRFSMAEGLAWVASSGIYIAALAWFKKRNSVAVSPWFARFVFAASVFATVLIPRAWITATPGLTQNKLGFFVSDVMSQGLDRLGWGATKPAFNTAYSFAHSEKTLDTLSPLLNLNATQAPNFVFIIVEGLGRDFSGAHARLGSFTPFLDELADRSLYWENFLSTQGRTFAVLPSVFGSLPFASYGTQNIAHDSLLSVLKTNGYSLNYFSGSNLEFDHQGDYLKSEGVQTLYSQSDFDRPQRKITEWGYPDRDLFEFMADKLTQDSTSPRLSIVQTMSMHTPFLFPEIEEYRKKVDARLDQLKVPVERRAAYQQYRDIYASILYTDDALRRFFTRMAQTPQWRNTIVLITGDHRLPELPMDTRLERYHVPLIVASPMIQSPQRIRAMSSHFDIAPALVAMMSHQYGFETPARVSWMGTGLDTSTSFRNLHALPLKQTKTSLSDYVSGLFYLSQDQLYQITENFEPAPITHDAVASRLRTDFHAVQAAITQLDTAERLTPAEDATKRIHYQAEQRTLEPSAPVAQLDGVVVSDTTVSISAQGMLQVQGVFANHDAQTSRVFVPLLVLLDAQGHQLAEASGAASQLAQNETKTYAVSLKLPASFNPATTGFVSLIVSDPDTGKFIGHGQYHVALQK
jgi:glucan phosphoethanolaminetransferase (alkaline phosphatase superfamily)